MISLALGRPLLRGCCPTLPPPNQGQGWDPRWTWRVADRCLPHSRRTVQRSVQSRKKGGQQKVTMTQPRAGRPTPHLHLHPAYSQQLPLLPSIPRRPSSPSETADTGRRVSTVPGRLCVPRPSGCGRQRGPGSSRWELVRVGRERRVRSGILPGADLTPRGCFCLPSSLLPLSGVT